MNRFILFHVPINLYITNVNVFWTLAAGLYPAIYASRITLAKAIKNPYKGGWCVRDF